VAVGFRDQFRHYTLPTREVEKLAFTAGLIVLDTNVLLNVYRFAPSSRDQLLAVIGQLRERIWIPHQVGLEFYRRRLKVMAEMRSSYGMLHEQVMKANEKLYQEVSQQINQLANRVLLHDEKTELLGLLESALTPLTQAIAALKDKHELEGSYADDPTLRKLEALLEGRIGDPFPDEELEAEKIEARRRVDAEEPPGYRDAAKDEPHGDYFVWAQTLAEAKKIQCPVVLLVTDDKKDDWYQRVNGQPLGARPELAREAQAVAGCQLVLLDAGDFLKRSKEYVAADVSAETIREAEGLPRQRARQLEIERLQAAAEHADRVHRSARAELADMKTMLLDLRDKRDALDAKIKEATPEGGGPPDELIVARMGVGRKIKTTAVRLDALVEDCERLDVIRLHAIGRFGKARALDILDSEGSRPVETLKRRFPSRVTNSEVEVLVPPRRKRRE